ncbi:uncharacterized protein LOC120309368 [Crotalus tigris]|uniref:uncharacterized protein LOC120309368 n=1 Tax=Crotalus tigris TaxID=88082 RepID=UPI00192F14B7|nr:uncharacterized protein LOC120309368 [Crotalus tigris]XP_039202472.1 uncharacterized protein LOC120309368 [Crotalus tigris]XP_039202479.1 uncharacterized protein LOC120309368 [Crotalus tigris]
MAETTESQPLDIDNNPIQIELAPEVPGGKAKAKSKYGRKTSKASGKQADRTHRAPEKQFSRAQHMSAERDHTLSNSTPPDMGAPLPSTSRAWSPENVLQQVSTQTFGQGGPPLFGEDLDLPGPSTAPIAAITPSAVGLRPPLEQSFSDHLQVWILQAVFQAMASAGQQEASPIPGPSSAPTTFARPPLDWSGMVSPSHSPESDSSNVLDYEGDRDGWSDCEEPTHESQPMTELFNASLFPSLLHRACAAGKLSSNPVPTPQPSSDQDANPLFAVPVDEHLQILCPLLFLKNIQGQWESPATQPTQGTAEHKIVDVAKNLADLLEVPKVDESLAPLFLTASLPTDVLDALKAEDKKSEMALRKVHLASAWAAKAATATSFFARISITWLRQLQDRIPLEEI